MYLPTLPEIETSRDMINVFGGYNGNLVINSNEFADMKNMTSDYYPVISPRRKRCKVAELSNPLGLLAKDSLAYVDGTKLYYNGNEVEGITLSTAAEMCPKHLVSMGAYILIFPDKIYFNTENISDYGYIESKFETQGETTFFLAKQDGEVYTGYEISDTAPENPADGTLWVDTSESVHTLKQYSEASSMWVSVTTTYIRIESAGIGAHFEAEDGVTISGCKYSIEESKMAEQIDFLNNTSVIQSKGENYITIIGIRDQVYTQESPISVQRVLPEMEYIIEANNRLWGCHYGLVNNQVVNEIYSSALGDFKNWRKYQGISTDSYAVSLGSDGAFTGAITYLGQPLFFKENCIHKIYGSMPANYQLLTTNCRGVQKGSHKSLSIIDEIVYYKSAVDVCAYDGSLPVSVSSAITEHYRDAVGCGINGKYYISMQKNGEYTLFVFDSKRGVWHKEDNTRFIDAVKLDTDIFYVDGNKNLMSVSGNTEHDFEWMVETGDIGMESPDHKFISRLNIRLSKLSTSTIQIFAMYDSDGNWESKGKISTTVKNSFIVPIIPKRCDHMRLRIAGKGDAKIYSISKISEQGSDL